MVRAAGMVAGLEGLASGGEGPTILVVDFVPFSAAQRFGALLSAQDTGRTIYQIDPVTDLMASSSYVPLPDLAAVYAQAFSDEAFSHRPPMDRRTVVVGHCSAAALALLIADELARRCQVSPLLVRPIMPGPEMIRTEFARCEARLGSVAGPPPSLDGAPAAVLERMAARLHDDLMAMATAEGLDTSSSTLSELLARYRSWLGFLVASNRSTVSAAPAHRPVRVVRSGDDQDDLSWLGASRETRIPVSDEWFTKSPAVAGEILSHFTERP
jgi:hypothetical protein